MIKNQIAKKIDDARKSHLQWIKRIKHLLEEVIIVDEMITLNPYKTEFGTWLYEEAKRCKDVTFLSETFTRIENEHILLHEKYFEIYSIYFVQRKRSFKNFFTKSNTITFEKREEARKYYYELIEISDRLLVQLNNLERKVRISRDESVAAWIAA